MSNVQVVQGYVVEHPLTLSPSLGMKFELEAGVAIAFSRHCGSNGFHIEGSENVSPEWAVSARYVRQILTPEDFLRFRKEFNV
jgi:hypothetical protein